MKKKLLVILKLLQTKQVNSHPMATIFGEKYDSAIVKHKLFVAYQLMSNKKTPTELIKKIMSFYNSDFVETNAVDETTSFMMFNFKERHITPIPFYHNNIGYIQSLFPSDKIVFINCKKGNMLQLQNLGTCVFYSASSSNENRDFYNFVKVKKNAQLYSVGFYERMTGENYTGYLIAEPGQC